MRNNIDLALQITDALEDLKLDLDIKRIANGLKVVDPSVEITRIRASELRAKLIRATRLIIQLEAILKNN
jgi:hypothetical protein